MKTLSALAVMVLAAGTALAHTHLKSSFPAEGSILTAAPSSIELKFSEPTRVTAITLQQEGAAEQKLAPLPTSVTEEVKVPAPKLAAGKYIINWRAVGNDGHVMTGKVQFTIDPNGISSAGKPVEKHPHSH